MQNPFHKTNSMNAFLYALRYGNVREKIMTALPLTMIHRTNTVKSLAGGTLTEKLSALTECSETSIRDILGDLDATGWGSWQRHKGIFQVNTDIATADTRTPQYIGLPLAIAEMDRMRFGSRISGLFERQVRRRKTKDEDDDMTKAMLAEIKDLKEAVRELTCVIRVLAPKDIETQQKLEPYLRLVENESN